ncbi:MAG: signal peptidase I [Clostridia bacterium]|nr:signal peptidase I [Clostridia bacterium]
MDNGNERDRRTPYGKAAAYIYSLLSMILAIMVCFFILFTFLLRLVSVSGDSMNPNVFDGEKIVVSDLFYTPDYGDVVVIGRSTETENSIIKRVIALPGDELYINFSTHLITVNGNVITEGYRTLGAITDEGDLTYPLTVPEDCVFVLGDNRNNSLDSRFSSVGFIRLDEITGKALFRVFPPGKLY